MYARTARFTAGAPRGFPVVRRRRGGSRSSVGSPAPTGPRRCGCSTSDDRCRAAGRRPGRPAGRRRRAAHRRERARRERMREGGAGIAAFALDDAGPLRGVRALVAAVRRRPRRRRARRASCRPPVPSSTRGCPRTGRRSPTSSGGALHVVGVDGAGRRRCWRSRSGRRHAAGSPSSSPPRSWSATGATGGRRLGRRAGRAGRRRQVQVWHVADPAHPECPRPSTATRRPASPTPTSRCGCSGWTAAERRCGGTTRRSRTCRR